MTNHNTDDSQEDDQVKDKDSSDWSEEGSIEDDVMAYETAVWWKERKGKGGGKRWSIYVRLIVYQLVALISLGELIS